MEYGQEIILITFFKGKGSLDNGYLDNLDNEFSNKYEKRS
jgi:hypothetical protein